MKQKLAKFSQKRSLFFLASIGLPIIIMALCYYSVGIYPGSDKTILASDALSQYANFHASLNRVLHGEQSIFYTWDASLGLNFWTLSAYYLNGLFSPFVYFFDNIHMPDTLYFITLLKFGAVGGAFWYFSTRTFKLSDMLHLGLSISYALMSYAVAYSEVIMWLDTFIYLPLIVLGIHRVMDERKPVLLFFSYVLLFLTNFYMSFMVGVFTFLYVLCRTFTDKKRYFKRFKDYLITSFCAGFVSMVTILPTILDLMYNGESLSPLQIFWQPDTGIWDFFTKSMVGVYDTTKYESAPFIYVGLIPLVFCLFYFVNKQVPLKNKLLYGSLFTILIASVYIYPLNLFWHGMHAPNMFLYRFSFLYSFLVILLSGYALEKVTKQDIDKLVNIFLALFLVFLGVYIFSNKQRYGYIKATSVLWTIAFIVVYLLLWFFYQKSSKTKVVIYLIASLMIVEAGINAQAMVTGIKEDWRYPARIGYEEGYEEVSQLVNQTKEENTTFYRMENLNKATFNDNFKFGYSGIAMFSSIRNRHSSTYLDALGFRSRDTNLIIDYTNNTLIMDALFGIKYNISKQEENKYGFEKIAEIGGYKLYENQFALSLGILTDEGIYKEGAVANQTELVKYLSQRELPLFMEAEAKQIKVENTTVSSGNGKVVYTRTDPSKNQEVTWQISVPAQTQAYLSLAPTDLTAMYRATVNIQVGDYERSTALTSTGQYHNLGYYEKATVIDVTATFSNTRSAEVGLYQPDVILLNKENFEETVKDIQQKSVDFSVSGRTAEAEVELEKDQVIFTTIPYDKGWSAYVDGKKVDIPTFKDALLTLPVEKGTHTVKFVFFPYGLKAGILLAVTGLAVFSIYIWLLKKQKVGKK